MIGFLGMGAKAFGSMDISITPLGQTLLTLRQYSVINVEILALDSTCAKVHPDGCGAFKKAAGNLSVKHAEVGTPSFMWYPQMIKSSPR